MDGPYRTPGEVVKSIKGNVMRKMALIALLSFVAGLSVGHSSAPDRIEVEVEVDNTPDLTHRENGCIQLCKFTRVEWFLRNDSHSYLCQCEGARAIPVGAIEGIWGQ